MELWTALVWTAFLIGVPSLAALLLAGIAADDHRGEPKIVRRVIWAGLAGVAVALGVGIAAAWVQVGG